MDGPASKRRRYSLECDVEIEVANGETLQVHSHVLMTASEVFANMLTSDMQEARTGRILLKDKSKADLEEVLQHLDLRSGAGPPPVTDQNVEVLLQFADEYEVTGLRHRCISSMKELAKTKPLDSLDLACKFNMPEVVRACVEQLLEQHASDEATQQTRHAAQKALQGLEENATVRSTLYRELFKMVLDGDNRKRKDEAKAVPCSNRWNTLVNMLLRMKRARGWSLEWNRAFVPIYQIAIHDFEQARRDEYETLKKDWANIMADDQEGEDEEDLAVEDAE